MAQETLSILTVEDNDGDARLIELMLNEAAILGWDLPLFELVRTATLRAALARLDEGGLDAVLTDLDLPDSRAGDTFARLHAHAPYLPIVVLTGREDEKLARHTIRAGAEDYLFKREMNGSLLAHTLLHAIERQRAKAALQEAHDALERKVRSRTTELEQANEQLRRQVDERKQAEEALRESEATMKSVFRAAPIGIGVVVDRVILNVNDRFCEITGYSQDELVGQSARKVYPSTEEYEYVGLEKYRQIAECGSGSAETRFRRKDGRIVDILLSSTPLDPTDLSSGVTFTALDITERKRMENELRESERRLQRLMQNARDLIYRYRLSPERGFEYVSPAATAITGYTPEEHYDDPDLGFKLVHPDDRPLLEAASQGTTAYNEPLVLRWVRKNGEVVWTEQRNVPIYDEAGNLVALEGIARDISEYKLAEQALQESKSRFEEIYTESPIGIELYDADGNLVDVNPACMEIFGVADTAAVQGFRLFADPNLPEMARERLLQGETVQYEAPFDFEAVKKQGLYETTRSGMIHLDVKITALGIRDGASLSGYLVHVQDITGRKQADRTVRESEERLNLALRGADLGLWDWNVPSGDVVFNARWAEMLGYTLDEIAPRVEMWQDLVHPDDLAGVMESLAAHLAGETAFYETEHRLHARDGSWRWILDRGKVLEWDEQGRPLRIVGTHLDVTGRKQSEAELTRQARELARSNTELEQLAEVVSHDLREPLRMVASYLRLLEHYCSDQLDQKAREYIAFAVDGATRMEKMISALRNLSRVTTHGQDFVPTDLEMLLANVLQSLQFSIAESDARITHDPLPTVLADAAQLAQVFQNLIGNALKFRREGAAPLVHISAERADAEWRFAVRDNGIGIDSDHTERLFQIFQRLHTRDEYEGTGIGLALCRRIVERHGGHIWVESQPGAGSTFYHLGHHHGRVAQPGGRWAVDFAADPRHHLGRSTGHLFVPPHPQDREGCPL